MKVKYQLLDLFTITTCVASLAGAYQTDLTLFRQLSCIVSVAVFSSAAVLLFPKTNRKKRTVGGMGGLVGGLCYLAFAFVLAAYLYEPEPFRNMRAIPAWYMEVPVAVVLSVLFGATIGPLIALRFQGRQITGGFKQPFWFSIILIFGIFLLGVFAMFDRKNMEDRNWQVISLVLSIVFVIHTNQWLTRFEIARVDQLEDQTQEQAG